MQYYWTIQCWWYKKGQQETRSWCKWRNTTASSISYIHKTYWAPDLLVCRSHDDDDDDNYYYFCPDCHLQQHFRIRNLRLWLSEFSCRSSGFRFSSLTCRNVDDEYWTSWTGPHLLVSVVAHLRLSIIYYKTVDLIESNTNIFSAIFKKLNRWF